MGVWEAEKWENARVNAGENKLSDVTTFNEEVKENTQNRKETGEQER